MFFAQRRTIPPFLKNEGWAAWSYRRLCLGAVLVAALAPATDAAPPPAWCRASPTTGVDITRQLQKDTDTQIERAPHPMPVLHTEGTLPGQGIRDASIVAKRDFPLMRRFALLWRVTGDERYRERVGVYLDAWAITYKPGANPIDETGFDALIDAYVIARDALTPPQRANVESLLRRMAQGYVDAYRLGYTTSKSSWINNWQSHRIKLITMIAVALDDSALFDQARRMFKQQIDVNLRADGSVLDFYERDALHYVVYDLEPLVRAAVAADLRGEDWLHLAGTHGASIAHGLNWLTPYALGQKTHEEFVKSKVAFDAARAKAGVKGFSGPFDPQKSRTLYWLASTLDAKYAETAKALGPADAELRACR